MHGQDEKPTWWIFANGEIPSLERLQDLIRPGDRLLAADGGVHHLLRLGRLPERVIGDLDSLLPGEAEDLERKGVALERYPVDKDDTDLELTLNYAIHAGGKVIRIAGALGGRLDQTLGNLFLLLSPALAGLDVRLEDGSEQVSLVRERAEIHGRPGDTVSLLPLNQPAAGVATRGLKYPLYGETLYPDRTRGISNVLVDPPAEVRLTDGILVCILKRG